jgi:hypothetical protein
MALFYTAESCHPGQPAGVGKGGREAKREREREKERRAGGSRSSCSTHKQSAGQRRGKHNAEYVGQSSWIE